MGVTMTMPEGHAILDCGAALDCIGEVAAARTAQGHQPRLEKRVALQLWTKFNVLSLEVMAIRWKRRLLLLCLSKLVMPRPGLKRLLFYGSTPHMISRRVAFSASMCL